MMRLVRTLMYYQYVVAMETVKFSTDVVPGIDGCLASDLQNPA